MLRELAPPITPTAALQGDEFGHADEVQRRLQDPIGFAKERSIQVANNPILQDSLLYRDLPGNLGNVIDVVCKTEPLHLEDIATIAATASDEQFATIFGMMSEGIVFGPKVLRRFSQPVNAVIKEYVRASNKDEIVEEATEFGKCLESAFFKTYLQALSTFAGILESPEHKLQEDIFANSPTKRRTIGYTSIDDALYALTITNYALLRAFTSSSAKDIVTINPYGDGSKEVILGNNSAIDALRDKPVELYIRPTTEYNRQLGEFGRGREVEGSISLRIPKPERMDRRKNKAPKVTAKDIDRRRPISEIKGDILRSIADSEVSFRLDFEGGGVQRETDDDITLKKRSRGIVLDIGGVSNDVRGMSYVVGNLFAIGDIRTAAKTGRETTLNHQPLPSRYNDKLLFSLLARSVLQSFIR